MFMITIELQNDNRYEIFDSDKSIGYISGGYNSFHAQNKKEGTSDVLVTSYRIEWETI